MPNNPFTPLQSGVLIRMKLYYFPGACSLAVRIALNEAGASFDCEKVDLAEKKTESGANYLEINPKGYVPALELDNGELLTEVGALLQYVADQNGSANLLAPVGDLGRYRVLEAINYCSTELHKNFGPMFNPAVTDEEKAAAEELIGSRLALFNDQLNSGPYLFGDQFTIADAYLITILGWTQFVQMDISPWPNLGRYVGQAMGRAAVQKSMQEEGLG